MSMSGSGLGSLKGLSWVKNLFIHEDSQIFQGT
jgi:hypothetical protein